MSQLTQIQRKVWWILYLITTQNVFALPDPLFPLKPVYINPRSNPGSTSTDNSNTNNGTNLGETTALITAPTGTSGGGEEPVVSSSSSDNVIAEESSPFHRTRKGPPRPRKPPPPGRRHPPPMKAPMPPPPQSALIIKPSKLKQPNKDYMIYKHKVPKKNPKNRHQDRDRPPYSILDPDHPPHAHHDHPPHPSKPSHPIHNSKPPPPFQGTSGENNSNRRPALRDLIKDMANSAESKSFERVKKHPSPDHHHREREPNSSFNPDEYYPNGGSSGSEEKSYPPSKFHGGSPERLPPPSRFTSGSSERPGGPPPPRYNSGSSERPGPPPPRYNSGSSEGPPPPPSYSSGSSERPRGPPPPYSSGSSERPGGPPPPYSSGSSERPRGPPPPYSSGSSELPRPPPKFPRGNPNPPPPSPPKYPKGSPQPSPSGYNHHHPGPAPFPKPPRPVKLSYYYDSNDKTDLKTLISSHHLKRRGKECDGLENFVYDLDVIAFLLGVVSALIGLYSDVIPFFNEGVKINYSTNHGDGDDYPHDYWQTHAAKIDAIVSKRQGALGTLAAKYPYPQSSRTIPIQIGTKEDEIKEVVSVSGEFLSLIALGISFVALFPSLVEKFFYTLDWWFGKRGLWKQYLYTYKCEVHPYPDPVGWGWKGN